ncbi:MAG: HEAT repeat domain-containing protein, partial [Candidatus Brocadiia bacterium]
MKQAGIHAVLVALLACGLPSAVGDQSFVSRRIEELKESASAREVPLGEALGPIEWIPETTSREPGTVPFAHAYALCLTCDPAVPARVAHLLADERLSVSSVAAQAARMLAEWPVTHGDMEAALREALSLERDPFVHVQVAQAIGKIARTQADPQDIVALFHSALEDATDDEVRSALIMELGSLGRPARGAVPLLEHLAQSGNPEVSLRAHAALVKLLGPSSKHLD